MDNRLTGKVDHPPPLEKIEAMLACLQADGTPFSLTPEERFVVMGRAGQKTYQTLARDLNHSLDTVHRRMRRGIEKLKKCMEAKGYT
jgi:DNA-directed RNA polymerase specialized sigma24 family protein